MKVRWEYLKQNIGSDNDIAFLIKESNNEPILYVKELRTCYRASPCKKYNFLDEFFVSYREAQSYVSYIFGLNSSDEEFQEKCVDYACDKIKSLFDEQVANIFQLLS